MTAMLSTDDAALMLGFKAKTIRAWCARGVFPGARKLPDDAPRSAWRIPEADVANVKSRRAVEQPARLDNKRRRELLAKLA